MNWLQTEGLHFIHTLTKTEQEACRTVEGLFKTFSRKFRAKHNKTILSFQYYKLNSQSNQTAGQRTCGLKIKLQNAWFKQNGRCLKEQFINL